MKNLPATIFTLALIPLAGGLWWYSKQAPEAEAGGWGGGAALVSLQPVTMQTVQNRVEAVGTLIANESVVITSKVSDSITAIHFEDGDIVEEGDILLELTNQEQSALLAEARANLTDARLQLERLERLGTNVASQSQIDEARARYDANQGRLDAIIARMEDRLIRAPFSGMLGFREVSPGTLVTPSTRISTLDDIDTLKLEFSVPETAFGGLQSGDEIIAKSAAYPGTTFSGQVTAVDSRIDPVTRSVQVRAEIPNVERRLRPGMLLTLTLIADEYQALVIPEASVLQKGTRSLVYVANAQMQVFERDIQIERRLQGTVVISGGLEIGEKIVVDGIMGVRNGAQVRLPAPEGSAAPAWGG